MKKRHLKKKVILLFLLIILIVIGIIYFINRKKIEFVDDLDLEINSEVYISSLIKNNVKLKSDKLIDTSTLGTKDISFTYKYKKYKIEVSIVDTISPVITYEKEISTTVNSDVDLLENVSATDNSKEDIIVKVEGDYNLKKTGTYNLKYVASDSSNNKTEEEFTLNVKSNNTTTTNSNKTYNYKKIDEPSGDKEYVGTTNNGFSIYKINGSYYIDGYLIANKTYALSSEYVPSNTYKSCEGITSTCNTCINNTAYSAWLDMQSDAQALGLNIWIQSGYRPYSSQVKLYNNYVERDGKEAADTYSARAGHSEHQTGLSFDLNTITSSFANTKEGKWVNDNAANYGFVIRFPNGADDKTGYKYEPWHLRYVGTDLANKLYNNGNWISLEEYFGITSEYTD